MIGRLEVETRIHEGGGREAERRGWTEVKGLGFDGSTTALGSLLPDCRPKQVKGCVNFWTIRPIALMQAS